MEVHHSHHSPHKKTWKSYFAEFLMLFLAVYLGFLAENFREHQVEHARGRQYTRSFYEDLKNDTGRINQYLEFDRVKLEALKDPATCFDSIANNKAGSCLLDIFNAIAVNRPFKMTERTLNQLLNAGGFRLLKDADADSISVYQKKYFILTDFQTTVYQDIQNDIRHSFNELLGYKTNLGLVTPGRGRYIVGFDGAGLKGPIEFSNDKVSQNRFFNQVILYYRVTYNHYGTLLDLKEAATSLIEYFKRKYHFD